MVSSFAGNWMTSPDACTIGKRMIDLCRTDPANWHCFWLGITDKNTKKMHRAFILGLPVLNDAGNCIVGVEMRILHKASIKLRSGSTISNPKDLRTVAQWMVL